MLRSWSGGVGGFRRGAEVGIRLGAGGGLELHPGDFTEQKCTVRLDVAGHVQRGQGLLGAALRMLADADSNIGAKEPVVDLQGIGERSGRVVMATVLCQTCGPPFTAAGDATRTGRFTRDQGEQRDKQHNNACQ